MALPALRPSGIRGTLRSPASSLWVSTRWSFPLPQEGSVGGSPEGTLNITLTCDGSGTAIGTVASGGAWSPPLRMVGGELRGGGRIWERGNFFTSRVGGGDVRWVCSFRFKFSPRLGNVTMVE